jgi:hypothetical protein
MFQKQTHISETKDKYRINSECNIKEYMKFMVTFTNYITEKKKKQKQQPNAYNKLKYPTWI